MGLRMGTDFGISLQQTLFPKATFQGIISTSAATSKTTATVLVQNHQPLISKRFNFFIGGGLHYRWTNLAEGASVSKMGVTAIAGAEMTLGRLNLSWDYKPVYHLNADVQPFESETAVSLRYVFVKKKKKGKNKGERGLFGGKLSKKERERRRKDRQKAKRKRERLRAKELKSKNR